MIERHYGQTRVLVGIEHETARRKKAPKKSETANSPVPEGAVDATPAGHDAEDDE